MASVTGRTSLSLDELINSTIIDGEIVNNHLILRARGGAEIDAGLIDIPFNPLSFMPVGYIYMSVDATSPAILFGGGVWARISQGRVLVGQDSAQAEFDVAEETGGEKTHTLTPAELAAHAHSIDHDHASASTSSDNNHTHTLERKSAAGTSTGVVRGGVTLVAQGTTDATPAHSHTFDVPAFTGTGGSTAAGTGHNNLQPYLVVYIWKRVS
jgi:microcystin-dependent protein